MKTMMQSILLPFSALILAASIIIGGLLIASPSNGGFFPDMGFALGILALGAGNCLSFFLNAVCWGLGYRPRWFSLTLLVQALPALLAAGGAANELWDGRVNERAYAQLSAIEDAITNDDLTALTKARSGCSERCQALTNADNDLLTAAWSSSHNVAKHLIEHGATVGIDSWYRGRRDVRTCEGSYIPLLMPLSISVARDDMDMVRLLLPVSDQYARTEALRTAAGLDRLEYVIYLFSNGVPLRNPAPNRRDDHLLSAAASGAAMHVGEWLLIEQPAAIEDADMQKAAEALFYFVEDAHASRMLDFARMLKDNGANFNASFRDEPSFLDESIRIKRKDIARVLLSLDVDTSRLSPERAAALSELLKEPDRPVYDERTEGCVETGG